MAEQEMNFLKKEAFIKMVGENATSKVIKEKVSFPHTPDEAVEDGKDPFELAAKRNAPNGAVYFTVGNLNCLGLTGNKTGEYLFSGDASYIIL